MPAVAIISEDLLDGSKELHSGHQNAVVVFNGRCREKIKCVMYVTEQSDDF